jgi:hypothetical protein
MVAKSYTFESHMKISNPIFFSIDHECYLVVSPSHKYHPITLVPKYKLQIRNWRFNTCFIIPTNSQYSFSRENIFDYESPRGGK